MREGWGRCHIYTSFIGFVWCLFVGNSEYKRRISLLRSLAALGHKQWDGLLLNLNGIAMCQTERSVFFQ
jgi:hypothetical protein